MSSEITFDQWKAKFFRDNGNWRDLSDVELSKAWFEAWQTGYREGLQEGGDQY